MPSPTHPEHRAIKSHNSRNGTYWSLRVFTREGSDGYEWARLRKRNGRWDAWASDPDFDRLLKFRVSDAKTLADALAAAKDGLHEWES